jgi:ribosomal protein L11 methyltransferase
MKPFQVKKSTDKDEQPSARADPPGWLEVFIEVHPVAVEAVSAFLFPLGCHGVVLGEKGKPFLKAYLPVTERLEELRGRLEIFLGRLKDFFPEAAQFSLHFSRIEDEDWSLSWRRHFHVERITETLTIAPAWEPVPQAHQGMVIRMDPGPAFGTGSHATTRMCLRAIEDFQHLLTPPWVGGDKGEGEASKHPHPCPPPSRGRDLSSCRRASMQEFGAAGHWTLLDVGTGSGILAIYGAKLGAKTVLAIDTDPEALRWAQRNIDLNHCSTSIELSSKSVGEVESAFSILVANLTRDALLELLPHFQRLLEKEGTMILSGLLQEQVKEVQEPLRALGLKEIKVATQAEWACITARRAE